MAKKHYSLLRVLRAMNDGKPVDGLERELHCEMEIIGGRKASHGGVIIPDGELLDAAGVSAPWLRASAVGSETFGYAPHGVIDGIGGNGGATDGRKVRLDLWARSLTAKTVLGRLGVHLVDGLIGTMAFPVDGAVNGAWMADEGAEAAKVCPDLGQRISTPKCVAAYTEVTRHLLLQTSNAVEEMVGDILTEALGRAVETAAFIGSGTNGEPRGIINTGGVTEVTTGLTTNAPTMDEFIDMSGKVYDANCNEATMAWVGSSKVRRVLRKTRDYAVVEGAGAVGGRRLLGEDGRLDGTPFVVSGLCGTGRIFFGDWSQLMLTSWRGGTEILVDSYTLGKRGASRISAFHDCDIVVKHPAAFVYGTAFAD